MNKVVLYCRPGFEKECAAEITDKAARLEVFGFARVKEDSGYVIFEGYQQDDGEKLVRDLPFSSLIFARQMFVVGELLRDLPRHVEIGLHLTLTGERPLTDMPQFAPDGVMPAGGPETVLRVMQATQRGLQGRVIDLERTYTDAFARAAR